MRQRTRKNYSCVLDLLGRGEDAARSAANLAAATGTDKRTVRRLVSEARREGMLVCSGDSGYWLPGNREELSRSCARMMAQARNIFRALRATRRALADCDGQGTLGLNDGEKEIAET